MMRFIKGKPSIGNHRSLLVKGILAFLLLLVLGHRARRDTPASSAISTTDSGISEVATSSPKQQHCVLSQKAQFNGDSAPGCPTCLSQKDQDVILENIFETIGTTWNLGSAMVAEIQ
jgi:hypothetical protein